jgi:hypothetical protein
MPRMTPPLAVSPPERLILETVAASEQLPANVRKRARVVLMAGDGADNCTIGLDVCMHRSRVHFWRRRFSRYRDALSTPFQAGKRPLNTPIESLQIIDLQTLISVSGLGSLSSPIQRNRRMPIFTRDPRFSALEKPALNG